MRATHFYNRKNCGKVPEQGAAGASNGWRHGGVTCGPLLFISWLPILSVVERLLGRALSE